MKYCKNGSKCVARETFILMNEGWKKKPWNLKKIKQRWIFNLYCIQQWLQKWKILYGIREETVNSEAGEVLGETVNAWMERFWELTKDYDPVDNWNMDETGCFFKALPGKGLAEKKRSSHGW